MTALQSRTFTTLPTQGEILGRRAKVIARLEGAETGPRKGQNFSRTNRKWVKNGESVRVEQQQRVPRWFAIASSGSYALFVQSELKPSEFEKGNP